MKLIKSIRPWTAAIYAFIVSVVSWGKADAATYLAFALPMCMFFVCAVAHLTQKQLFQTQAELNSLRETLKLQKP